MARVRGLEQVKGRIDSIYKKRIALSAADNYATNALRDFQARQQSAGIGGRGQWWTNRTGQAADRFDTVVRKGRKYIGFEVRHLVPYAIYLEIQKGRTALQDITFKWGVAYINYVRGVFGLKKNTFKLIRGRGF